MKTKTDKRQYTDYFKPSAPLQTAVLFLVFNRPDTTKQVFEKIREARPPRLYVTADGPRKNKEGDAEKCERVREIATTVDWDCEVKTLFRDENLGCKMAVSGGIDWFFENEEMGIILEDDCLPNKSFFKFCEKLLYKYEDVQQVMTISGNNFQPKRRTENSYYFSKYMHCWGWASWRRAWGHFDLEMSEWQSLKKQNFLSNLFSNNKAQKYWQNIFNRVFEGEIDSWAYIWQYSIWKEKGVNILPEENLVSNIGFGEEGTHTSDSNSKLANIKAEELLFPLKHPSIISLNKQADSYTLNKIYFNSIWEKILRKLSLIRLFK
ncbi:MAG: hypothetical protein WD512_19440 [Candidatus Paceibacterota bacterium]